MTAALLSTRPERAGDATAIHAVHAAAFATPLEANLVDRLRAAGRLLASRVAERDGAVAGHIAFSPVAIDGGPERARGAGLAPLAVLPAMQRRGLGAALVRDGLDACARQGIAYAVVLGDPAYYGRFGFRPARAFGLACEFGGGDAFQAIELVPGALGVGGGGTHGAARLVRYAPEFALFS